MKQTPQRLPEQACGHSGPSALLPLLWSKRETPLQTQPDPQPGLPLHPLWKAFHILAYSTQAGIWFSLFNRYINGFNVHLHKTFPWSSSPFLSHSALSC